MRHWGDDARGFGVRLSRDCHASAGSAKRSCFLFFLPPFFLSIQPGRAETSVSFIRNLDGPICLYWDTKGRPRKAIRKQRNCFEFGPRSSREVSAVSLRRSACLSRRITARFITDALKSSRKGREKENTNCELCSAAGGPSVKEDIVETTATLEHAVNQNGQGSSGAAITGPLPERTKQTLVNALMRSQQVLHSCRD